MKTYIVPILLGITLCCSSCVFLINTAIYGTNCETCQVLDFWGESSLVRRGMPGHEWQGGNEGRV